MAKKVIVAMSGGVDSSVAAALLKGQGFEVSGMFMKNWSPEDAQSLSDCPWEQDQADAAAVCEHLGIPFRSINFEKEYKERVVNYFLGEYAAGRTPNPDVMCNKEIKFDAFLKAAQELGADYIATGHYARTEDGKLYRGVDSNKDQSYFLYTLSPEVLSKVIFPLGKLTKPEVRELAAKFNLPTAQKKDSQGICFIGHIDLKKFLQEHIAARPGVTCLVGQGERKEERLKDAVIVGSHYGAMFYTIGERAGAVVDNGIYRKAMGGADIPPLYVVAKDAVYNRLYVVPSREDPLFYSDTITVEQWIGEPLSPALLANNLTCQIRYQQKDLVKVVGIREEGANRILELDPPVWAAAAGQSLVIYQGDQVIGGGIIA